MLIMHPLHPQSRIGRGEEGEKFREKLGGRSKKFVFIWDSSGNYAGNVSVM